MENDLAINLKWWKWKEWEKEGRKEDIWICPFDDISICPVTFPKWENALLGNWKCLFIAVSSMILPHFGKNQVLKSPLREKVPTLGKFYHAITIRKNGKEEENEKQEF